MKIQCNCIIHGNYFKRKDRVNEKCPKCVLIDRTKTTETFIKEVQNILGNAYDYSQVHYNGARQNVIIICKVHGEFQKLPTNLLRQKQGCPKCNSISKGESIVENWLKEKSISYISQMRFKNCRGKVKPLPFDFYLPDYNTCIEYNGKQHYLKESKFYSKELIENDKIKAQYCLDNNIRLITIPYWEDVCVLLNSLNLAIADSKVL